jgi:hypothetical protein
MQPLPNGLAIMPCVTVELRSALSIDVPGSREAVHARDSFIATLQFEKAGSLDLKFITRITFFARRSFSNFITPP